METITNIDFASFVLGGVMVPAVIIFAYLVFKAIRGLLYGFPKNNFLFRISNRIVFIRGGAKRNSYRVDSENFFLSFHSASENDCDDDLVRLGTTRTFLLFTIRVKPNQKETHALQTVNIKEGKE